MDILRFFHEFTQTHIHRVSDAIQPSHPLSSPILVDRIKNVALLHKIFLNFY